VAAGTTPTWLPTADLPQTQQLHLRVKSTDTYNRTSAYSSWYTFTVDATAPATPSVSSSLYPDKNVTPVWNGGAGVPGVFTFAPNGATDVVQFKWRINSGAETTVNVTAGASANVTITPTSDLQQLLEVQALDAAGWTSAWKQYPFYVRPQPGDVAYWKLDGNTVPANGGTSYTGTSSGGPTFETANINPGNPSGSGQAIRLDGTDDFVYTPRVLATDHAAGFSVSAWVKPDVLSGTRTVVAQQGVNTYAARLFYDPTAVKWCFGVSDADSTTPGRVNVCSGLVPQAGVWTHLAGVYDPVTGTIRLYVNGGPENGYPADGVAQGSVNEVAAPAMWAATGAFRIGRSDAGNFFDGAIDEVRAYQRVLPEFEAKLMYRDCFLGNCPSVPAPSDPVKQCVNTTTPMCVGEWTLDDNTGTSAADSSDQDNPLALNGGTTWTTAGYNDTPAVAFDGISGYLSADQPLLLTDQSFTVSAWAKLTDKSTWKAVITQDGVHHSAFRLNYDQSLDKWCLLMRNEDTVASGYVRACGPAPTLGVWTHLAGVYDSATDEIRLYVNGQLAATTAFTTPWRATGAFTVGRVKYQSSYMDYFAGQIDLVRAYQGALSNAQVAQLFVEQMAPPKLVAWWELEPLDAPDAQDPFVEDWSGVDNHSALSASGAVWGEGRLGEGSYAAVFDGSTGYFETTSPVVDTLDSFSVAAWANLSGACTGQRFAVSQSEASGSVFKLFCDADGKWKFAVKNVAAVSDAAAQLGTWVHLAGVFDQATGQVRLYVNGQLQTATGTGAVGATSVHPLSVGAKHDGGGYANFFTGAIDSVRVYRGALTDQQAQNVYEDQEI
jgi:hypothetical protein